MEPSIRDRCARCREQDLQPTLQDGQVSQQQRKPRGGQRVKRSVSSCPCCRVREAPNEDSRVFSCDPIITKSNPQSCCYTQSCYIARLNQMHHQLCQYGLHCFWLLFSTLHWGNSHSSKSFCSTLVELAVWESAVQKKWQQGKALG